MRSRQVFFWAAPDVSIAVCEGGFSFIEESRSVRVRTGASRLLIDDLPAGIQPDTIVADFPTKGGVALQGQRFSQATASLLANLIGGTVSVITANPVTGAEVVRRAKLLRVDPRPLVQLEGRIERKIPGRIALPGLPSEALLRRHLNSMLRPFGQARRLIGFPI